MIGSAGSAQNGPARRGDLRTGSLLTSSRKLYDLSFLTCISCDKRRLTYDEDMARSGTDRRRGRNATAGRSTAEAAAAAAHRKPRATTPAVNASARARSVKHAVAVDVGQAAASYVQLIESAAPADQQRLVEAVAAPSNNDELDESIWGAAPSAATASAAELELLRNKFADRQQLAQHSLTREQAAQLLEVSAQAITDALQHGELAGLKSGRRWLIPSWQFDADSERGILPGVAELSLAFPGGVVSLSRWVTRSSPDLDDRTPRDVMAAGQADTVIALASQLTAAGW